MPRFGEGIYTVVPTPFRSDGSLDFDSVDRVTGFLIDLGVGGLLILGVLGEAPKLIGGERAQVVERVCVAAAGRVPVIVGASHPSSLGARMLSRDAAEAGAVGVMVSPPKLARGDTRGLIEFFEAVADGLEADIVLQDHPASSGVVLSPDDIAALVSAVPAVRHVKLEDPPTPRKVEQVLRATGGAVLVYGGLGGVFLLEELGRGAVGTMTGFAYPEILLEVYRAHRAGEAERAAEIFYRYLPLIRFEAQEEIGLAIRKHVYRLRGAIATEVVRAPGPTLDEGTAGELEVLLRRLGLSPKQTTARAHV